MRMTSDPLTGYSPIAGRMKIAPLAAMGISAGVGALRSLFGGDGGAAKQAKVDARNQNLLLADRRTLDQKQLDRRRKILQRLQKFYATTKLLPEGRGAEFADLMGDIGPEVGSEAYMLPTAPTMEAAKGPGFWSNLARGAFGGAMDYVGRQATKPVMYPTSPGQPTRAAGGPDTFRLQSGPSVVPGEDGVDQILGQRRIY